MPRQPKPYLRKQTSSWYCSIAGKQISLGKDRDIAFEKFHALMSDQEQVQGETTSLYQLSQVYLDWCQANRNPKTYELHRRFLKSFIQSVGKRLRVSRLKAHHLTSWHDSLGVGETTQHDAVTIVQRMLNWAVEQEYVASNPIAKIKKPRRKRRDVCYTPDQWEKIRACAKGPFGDFLDFLHLTGCRPREARTIEARHLHDDLAIFPADESKGEAEPRVIYLVPAARKLLHSCAKENPNGPLFRNSRGDAWTKNAVVLRLRRISKRVGFRVIAYGARHSFATNALTAGVDSTAVGHLMGHKDATMVQRVYGHLAKNPEFLRAQAVKAASRQRTN